MSLPLEGVKVLELGQIIAGTYGGQILSDMGADVIKIEAPSGDLGRNPSVAPINEVSGLFLTFNRNKKSVVIDMKTKEGRDAFFDLVKCVDVVVDNFRPGVMERLGIDYGVMSAINPRIIHCSITGFGSEGEYKNYPALDIIIQAISGHMAITGEPDRPPVRLGIPLADLSGGLFSSQGILAALYEREQTGKGQHIELAMFDAMLSLLTYMGTMWLTGGVLPKPPGSSHEYSVPWQAFTTKNSYVVVATREEINWQRFCDALSAGHLLEDPNFKTNALRVKNRNQLVPILEAIIVQETTEHWMKRFHQNQVPASPVNHFDQAFSEPPVLENKMVVEYTHPQAGLVRMPAYPVKIGNIDEKKCSPAPLLGEHTDEVLTTLLSYSGERIQELKSVGAIYNLEDR
jgi:crotonobetainyl-CoA:carnitine CoA-transferase CaiB-like acyl-CoA transferase